MTNSVIRAWAPWHPDEGYAGYAGYGGPAAFYSIDGAILHNQMLNDVDGTNKTNGWRLVPVWITRVEQEK